MERISPERETTPMPILLAEDSSPSASGPRGRRLAGDGAEDMVAAAAAAVGFWGFVQDDEWREESGRVKCKMRSCSGNRAHWAY